jgi:hypothetical protein
LAIDLLADSMSGATRHGSG